MCKLEVSIRRSGGGLQREGAERRYYPRGSMGALCHGHTGGESQGSELHPVIMFLKTQHRNATDYVVVCSHHSATKLICKYRNRINKSISHSIAGSQTLVMSL